MAEKEASLTFWLSLLAGNRDGCRLSLAFELTIGLSLMSVDGARLVGGTVADFQAVAKSVAGAVTAVTSIGAVTIAVAFTAAVSWAVRLLC